MKSFLLCIALVVFTATLHAQPAVLWQHCYGGSSDDLGYASARTTDGGFLLAGAASSSGGDVSGNHGGQDGWIVRTDSSGNIVWKKCYGGSAEDLFRDILVTSDGGFVAYGHANSTNGDVVGNHGGSDCWLVKCDAGGAVQWQHCYGGTLEDQGYSVVQTPDGGYLLNGKTLSTDGDVVGNHGGGDWLVIKTDASGNIVWQKCYGGTGTEWGYRVTAIPAGGYALAGISSSNNGDLSGSGSNGGEEYWGVVIDDNGAIVKKKCFGGSSWDDGYNMYPTADGGFALIGISASTNGMVVNGNGYPGDAWFVKTDADLNLQWQRSLGGVLGGERGFDIVQTPDGGYLVGCYTSSNEGDVSGLHIDPNAGFNTQDIWVVKMNYAGSIEWQKCLGGTQQEFSFEFKKMLHLTSNNDIYVFASTKSNDGDVSGNHQVGNDDFWLLKLKGNANKITGTAFFDLNNNQQFDTTDLAAANIAIVEAVTGNIAYTDINGNYSLAVPDSGQYSVQPVGVPYYASSPATQTAHFTAQENQTDAGNEFAFASTGVYDDLRVSVTPLSGYRRGFLAGYLVSYKNTGTTTLSGTVTFATNDLPNISQYTSSSVTPSFASADSVAWSFTDLAPFQSASVMVYVQVSIAANVGTPNIYRARAFPLSGDATPSDNLAQVTSVVVTSCDPNEIVVNVDTIYSAQFASPPALEYGIRFQNTGSDTAVNVRIADLLPAQLVPQSIELLAASHPVTMTYSGLTNELEFDFDNIMLPDSNVNEPASHGAVSFRVNPQANPTPGSHIDNHVDIYFDFNDAVSTNVASTEIQLTIGVNAVSAGSFHLYPNPTDRAIVVDNNTDDNALVVVSDPSGRHVLHASVQAMQRTTVSLAGLSGGVYYVSKVVNGKTMETQKLVVVR